MKQTPITDILNNKLSKLHSELDSLIIKKVKNDLTQEQYEALDEELSNEVYGFITLGYLRDNIAITRKIELFKKLEEL